jgi:hypothetical protein
MADKKVSELTAITNLSGDDLLLVVNDPSGSPTSNKITITNLFANVVPATTHKGVTTFKANTSFTGTTMTVSANLVLSGTNVLNAINDRVQVANNNAQLANTNAAIATKSTWSSLTATNTAIRTLVSDRLQVANAAATYTTKAYAAANSFVTSSYVTNTTFQDTISGADSLTIADSVVGRQNVNGAIIQVTTAGGLRGTKGSAPSSNNTATEGLTVGTIFFSNTYMYIATDATTIKRIPLQVFS